MQQLTQQLKSGHMELLELPFPALDKGQAMVRNHYSVISAGAPKAKPLPMPAKAMWPKPAAAKKK